MIDLEVIPIVILVLFGFAGVVIPVVCCLCGITFWYSDSTVWLEWLLEDRGKDLEVRIRNEKRANK